MDIKISLNGILSEAQQEEIALQLSGAKEPLLAFCRAAIAESADAILTRRPESPLTSQNRLYRLIKHAFDWTIPSETVVSRLFGITERRASTMISTVAKRYQSEFEVGWTAAVRDAFKSKEVAAVTEGESFEFSAPQTVIDYLKELVAGLSDGRLVQVQRVKGTAERYQIRKDTYDAVCSKLKIDQTKKAK